MPIHAVGLHTTSSSVGRRKAKLALLIGQKQEVQKTYGRPDGERIWRAQKTKKQKTKEVGLPSSD